MESKIEDGELPGDGLPPGVRIVEREILDLFDGNPFLLVDEDKLSSLLCRPIQLVMAAVSLLEKEGKLRRSRQHSLIEAASLEVRSNP